MTTAQLEHLKLIDAHLERLLSTAEKRAPGEYVKLGSYVGSKDNHHGVADCCYCGDAENEDNAAFIASCAGNAEAGWRATRAAIALCIANLHTDPEFPTHDAGEICDNDGQGCRACGYTERILLKSILAAFPLELIQKP